MEPLLISIARGKENSIWLGAHYADLARKFEGEWVAVYDKKVVAHGKNLSRMSKDLRSKYGSVFDEIAFDYVTKKPVELIL